MRACSTGSPASTRSTKLMPLTVRPSLMSRQGMMRAMAMGAAFDCGKDLPLYRKPGVRKSAGLGSKTVGQSSEERSATRGSLLPAIQHALRLRRVDPAIIEGAPRNHALELCPAIAKGTDVVKRRDAPRCDDRQLDGPRQRRRCRNIRPAHGAVAVDIGVDDRRDSGVLELAGKVERIEIGCLG